MIRYEGKWLHVKEKSGWEYAERPNIKGIVAMLPITDDDEIVLIEQFRIPVNTRVIEVPCGLVDLTDDSLEEAAKRELLEETGYRAKHLEELIHTPVSPGLSSEIITLFKATGLEKVHEGGGVESEHEDIKVHLVRIENVKAWLKDKEERKYSIYNMVYTALYFL